LLIRYGGVVSGSAALRYFLPRAVWEPNDLDIYIPEAQFEDFVLAVTDRKRLDFTLFPRHGPWTLLESRGTTTSVGPPPTASVEGHVGIREVRKFYTPRDRRVDIISVPSHNPVTALKGFWSSLVTNFLRPDMAACGSPRTTLEGVGILK
ncbi:hypothetical protein K466DRAFT_440812, partial [Polyporus arcularius HHB13444]